MKSKKFIWGTIIICVLLYLIPNIIYYYNFNNKNISDNPGDWGVYGDFIGGSINPILTILNIIALVYLTYTVSHLDDDRAKEQATLETRRNEDNINIQKIIALTQMRNEAISNLNKNTGSIFNALYSKNVLQNGDIGIRLGVILEYLISFKSNQQFLFEELYTENFNEECYNPLEKALMDLIEYYAPLSETKGQGDFNKLLGKYVETLSSFITELNKFTINEIK